MPRGTPKKNKKLKTKDKKKKALRKALKELNKELRKIGFSAALGHVLVNVSQLAPDNSYGTPPFVTLGYYKDFPFCCKDCGKNEIWKPRQQKWWYEVAKGGVWTVATRCRNCRTKKRKIKEEARRVHLEGLAKKLKKKA